MESKIPIVTNEIFGLECSEARVGYARSLVLGFGELLINPKLLKYPIPEWQFRTISCSWRVFEKDDLLCGDYDDEEMNDESLKSLLSLKMISIISENPFDQTLILENDYRISFLAHSKEESRFCLHKRNEVYIENDAQGKWLIKDANEPGDDELAEDEELLMVHSEKCFKRWEEKIPKYNSEDYCRSCIYFRPLRGEFYFWDYGLCSNEKANYDAKLVGVKSGCSEFSGSFKDT